MSIEQTIKADISEAVRKDISRFVARYAIDGNGVKMSSESVDFKPSKSIDQLIHVVAVAIIANGGGAYRQEDCECDPSVGNCPCRYCAVWNALNKMHNLLLDQKQNGTLRRLPGLDDSAGVD